MGPYHSVMLWVTPRRADQADVEEPTTHGMFRRGVRTTTDRLGAAPQFLRPQTVERRMLILLLPLMGTAALTSWAVDESGGVAQWYVRFVMLPSAVLFFGLLAWAIRISPARIWRVRASVLTLGPGIVLVGYGDQLWRLVSQGFDSGYYFGMSVWIIFACALYVFLLPTRYSWRFAIGYYLTSLAMLCVFLGLNSNALPAVVTNDFILNNVIAPPVFIVLLSAFTRLRTEYAAARAQAADLRELALVDGLTGLQNRRAFGQSFKRAKARLLRNKTPLCAMIFDIDHFKSVNDTFGHNVGDEVICKLGAVLSRELRGTDEVFRWGGEEFAALLDETPSHMLKDVAERVRLAVQNAALLPQRPVTISIGATHVLAQDTEESVFSRADAALYRSKQEGRNRVTIAEAPATLPAASAGGPSTPPGS